MQTASARRRFATVGMVVAFFLALLVPLISAGPLPADAASPPTFRISPTSLNFGNVPVGTTSASQTITVTNVSASAVVMNGIGGGGGVFGGAQSCQGLTLNPQQSCQMFYAFSPTTTGAVSGGASGTWNGQAFTFAFSGAGINRFTISPTRFDFGSVPLGTSSAVQVVNVTNASSSPAVISMTGGGGGVFGGAQNCQGQTLGAYQSCQIYYAFSPTALGKVTGSASGTVNGQAFSISFSGTGVDQFLISPTTLDFGEVSLGSSSDSQTVNVTNASGSAAVIQMTGGGAGEFGGAQNCQGQTLAAGSSCQIFYSFTPAQAGTRTSSANGTINGQAFTISFTGVGTGGVLTTTAPTISGTANVGQTLTAHVTGWTTGTAFAYQWNRSGTAISGATKPTYVPTGSDVGSTLTVSVTGSQLGYTTASRTSASTATVQNVFSAAPTPTISGTTVVGQKLTAVPGTWSPTTTLAYQWSRGGTAISGATASTYTLTNSDAGHTLTVTVTGTRSGYAKTTRVSAATATVTGGILTAPTPTITGTTTVGQKLTAVPGSWTSGTTLTYQWNRGGVAISGAVSSYHTLNAADAGHTITVTVTGTKAGFTTVSKTSAATAAVTNVFTTTPAPTISGTVIVGKKLTAGTGTWAPAPTSFSYQWKRSGVAISGATSASYTLVAADKGKTITVTVTGARSGYQSVSKTSAATAVVG